MRLFIGLWFDDAGVSELTRWAHDAHAVCGGRIMQPQDLHLTLAFLGSADADRADALARAVRQWPVQMEPLRLVRFGAFERARVVWAGPAEDDPPTWLYTLYATLWARLDEMGWRRPEPVFRPHVSLLRSARSCDVTALRRDPIIVHPQRCVLVASRPQGSSTNYQVLAPLRYMDSDTQYGPA